MQIRRKWMAEQSRIWKLNSFLLFFIIFNRSWKVSMFRLSDLKSAKTFLHHLSMGHFSTFKCVQEIHNYCPSRSFMILETTNQVFEQKLHFSWQSHNVTTQLHPHLLHRLSGVVLCLVYTLHYTLCSYRPVDTTY